MLRKKSITAVLVAVLAIQGSLWAQETWIRMYGMIGSDRVYSLDLAPDGSYICAGRSTSFSEWSYEEAYLLRVNASGDTLWTKHYGGPYDDRIYSVRTTPDSGFILAGFTEGTDTLNPDCYMIKTDRDGAVEWEKEYGAAGRDTAFSVSLTSDSGYVVAGYTESFGAGGADVWLLRLNSSGDTLWTRTFGGPGADQGNAVVETPDGAYLVAGSANIVDSAETDLYLLKVDKNGSLLWEKTYGGEWDDYGYFICPTADSGFAVVGATFSESMGWSDVWLLRLDASGDTLWTKKYGGFGKDEGYSVWQCSDPGFIIAGYTMTFGAGEEDFYVIRTDASGDTLWTRTFGGDGADLAYGARQVADGGFMIGGRTRSFGLNRCDVYLVKTDAQGNVAGVAEQSQQSPLKLEVKGSEIRYELPCAADVSLAVYDVSGRLVNTLVEGKVQAGVHTIRWEGKDNANRKCPSGVYFVRFEAADYRASKKMVMLK